MPSGKVTRDHAGRPAAEPAFGEEAGQERQRQGHLIAGAAIAAVYFLRAFLLLLLHLAGPAVAVVHDHRMMHGAAITRTHLHGRHEFILRPGS